MTLYTFFVLLFILQFGGCNVQKETISVPLFKSSDRVLKFTEPSTWTSVFGNLADIRKNFIGTRYYGIIGLGFPVQNFYVDFDTGALDFWVSSTRSSWFCLPCLIHNRYDFQSSHTYERNGTSFYIWYGKRWGSVSGFVSKDTLVMGGVSIKGQMFGEASHMSTISFSTVKYDGILGLAFSSSSAVSSLPPFFNAVSQGLIEPVFSFFLNKEHNDEVGGEITFGGVNSDYFTGKFYEAPVISKTNWGIQAQSLDFGNKSICNSHFELIVSSGVSVMIGSKELVDKIHAEMNVTTSLTGLAILDCSRVNFMPTLVFGFSNFKLEVTPDNYVVKTSLFGQNVCHSGFVGIDFETAPSVWIAGDNFMSAFYTKFDHGNKTVGFAQLRKK